MATISPGPVSRPPRKAKKPTQTTKAHRFEPFSRRIARLKIDPVHRVARKVKGVQTEALQGSHFRTSLDDWIDLNLSHNFTEFARKASPLCETLPQLLYHADTISELLLEYIGKRDVLSLESLLSLLAHFAHDLGARFEKYFADSVSLVASVAATHGAPEAIEWSFTCLAWVFKFLSKLLVPDLRPLLAIMVDYLGKTHQKEYITRFAAESMAFLIRKAAIAHSRDQKPLQNAMSYLMESLDDITSERDQASYTYGIMTLLSDTVKGVDYGIHECGSAVLQCLIDCVRDRHSSSTHTRDVLLGVWTNVLHHITPDTSSALMDLIPAEVDNLAKSSDQKKEDEAELVIQLAFVSVGTRKGSRVRHWQTFNQSIVKIAHLMIDKTIDSAESRRLLMNTLVLSACYSPFEGLLAFINPVSQILLSDQFSSDSVLFFSLLNKLSSERLGQFFVPTLQSFVSKQWRKREASLLACLLENPDSQAESNGLLAALVSPPAEWKAVIVQKLQQSHNDSDFESWNDCYLSMIETSPSKGNQHEDVLDILRKNITQSLHKADISDPATRLAMGKGFAVYNRLAEDLGRFDVSIWPQLCGWAPLAGNFPAFWNALLEYINKTGVLDTRSEVRTTELQATLLDNLLLDDISVKKASLIILERLWRGSEKGISEALQLAIETLETPYQLQTIRQLSMLVRNLAILWNSSFGNSDAGRLIPYFLLGLLSLRSPGLHKDIGEALAKICTSTTGETIVSDVINKWLYSESIYTDKDETEDKPAAPRIFLSPFQCLNLENVKELAETSSQLVEEPMQQLRADFESYHRLQLANHLDARSLAITILQTLPELAEKRSSQIVPLFLSSVSFEIPVDCSPPSDSSATSVTLSAHDKTQDWNRRDRKALLQLFGKFHNPRVLFRSSEIYSALLEVLSKGDPEMQKLALKAVFTWKQPSIRPYEEHLEKLTDDKTFRDELTTFFHADRESSIIEEAHRQELLPVVLRVLYGQMINRSGSRSNTGGQEGRRKLILRTLFRLDEEEARIFILIACGSLANLQLTQKGPASEHTLAHDLIPASSQYGFLNVVETMLETLQGQLAPFASTLQTAIVYCLIRAARNLDKSLSEESEGGESMFRRNRRLAIRCVDLLFRYCLDLDWTPYMPLLFNEVISPRLGNLPIETAQGTSALLHLFSTWASNLATIPFLNRYDETLLPAIGNCLTIPSARDEVKKFVLNEVLGQICDTIAGADGESEDLVLTVVQPHINGLLLALDSLLRSNPSRAVQDAAISMLSKMSAFATSPESASMLMAPLTLIIRQPAEKVSPHTKGNLLKALLNLLRVSHLKAGNKLHEQVFNAVSPLFNYFKDRANRSLLIEVLEQLAVDDSELQVTVPICADLNAYSISRLDEVDYDRRLRAFNILLESSATSYSVIQWTPILQNVIFFCREEDDFAIRSNAVAVLKAFIQRSSAEMDTLLTALRRDVIYPSLKRGLKAPSESIRADHLTMIGTIIQHDQSWSEVSDMHGLLANNDEEASFFTNALHIQQHRRLRALRRLETDTKAGTISSTNVTTIFLPLLEHFIFDPDEDPTAQNLAGQAIIAVGACLEAIEWGQYKAIFRRYKSYMKSKPEMEKSVIKLLSATADSLYRSAAPNSKETPASSESAQEPTTIDKSLLSRTIPNQEKLADELTANFIPDLTAFVHQKDEAEMSLRIPIAIAVVRLLKILSQERMALLLPPVLLDIANILKSRVQESRDTARRTLAEVSSILGSSCLGYILKELRTSLARGYQLHVLSYTVHSLLVSMVDGLEPGQLDYCLPSLVAIVMDDIFGAVGQEKDAEDYISKMKEVKSSKSFDSMELLARIATVAHLVQLVRPIQALLRETLGVKQARQVDELFRRIGVGLSRNSQAGTREILVFSYEIIQEFYKQKAHDSQKEKPTVRENEARFLVDLKARRQMKPGNSGSVFAYKSVRFALDLLRSVLHKHSDLMTVENLHGFVPIIGDALVEGQEDVRMSAMRLLSTIIKLPLPELDDNGQLYAIQAVKVIKDSIDTNTESSQAALKLVTAILRERRQIEIRDSDLAYLLHRIAPDLDQPDRQGVTFNFVKAVMARKVALAELYDLVDRIGAMMVTNQTRATRDAARGVFIHFLLDYPQSKSRWSKQVKFLVKNLDYPYPEGRQSVMEAVHGLLSKCGDETAQELVASLFIPVLLILSNDDSTQCREMAAALLIQLFSKADSEQLKSFLGSLRTWVEQTDNTALSKAGMQAYKIYFDADLPGAKKELSFIKSCVETLLENDDGELDEDSWEPTYYALQLLVKICSAHPEAIMSKQQDKLWDQIRRMIDHRHQWVQHSASKLIGSLFHDLGRANAERGLRDIPLANSHGMKLDAGHMRHIMRSGLRIIRTPQTGDELRLQTVRNLVFLGRCFTVNDLSIEVRRKSAVEVEGDKDHDREVDKSNDQEADGSHGESGHSDVEDEASTSTISALEFLLTALSTILRREPRQLKPSFLHPKLSALTLLGALINIHPSPTTLPSLPPFIDLLSPLLHYTSPTLPPPRTPDQTFQSTYATLLTSCAELLELLQQKLGSKLYVEQLAIAQRAIRQKREDRGRKRKVERVVDPEAYAREKKRRREGEKKRRKERAGEQRGKRRGY